MAHVILPVIAVGSAIGVSNYYLNMPQITTVKVSEQPPTNGYYVDVDLNILNPLETGWTPGRSVDYIGSVPGPYGIPKCIYKEKGHMALEQNFGASKQSL